ncbi:ankyrin repeat-containing domain protein [Aspergillus pseudoustus]|uniref:Ankyrin repeat-containing domain protein n=1 Tax=Aspergillus pseudoustus TaxID=1810923 RepID=A0ABR4JYZ1_9EURO
MSKALQYGDDGLDPIERITNAAAEGKTDQIQKILKEAPPASHQDLKNRALLFAAMNGNASTVKTLLVQSADQAFSHDGPPHSELCGRTGAVILGHNPTALHLAVERGHHAVTKLLLRRAPGFPWMMGVYPRTVFWMTALHVAVSNNDLEMAELLLRHGVPADYAYTIGEEFPVTTSGYQPASGYQWAKDHSPHRRPALYIAAARGDEEMVRLLLRYGDGVGGWRRKHRWRTMTDLVGCAAWNGRLGVVKFLLDYGFDMNGHGLGGGPALRDGAEAGHADVVEFLVKKGARLRGLTTNMGLLETAVSAGHISVVRRALEMGQAPADEGDCQKAIGLAVREDKTEIFGACLEYASSQAPPLPLDYDGLLRDAVRNGNLRIVQGLLFRWKSTNWGEEITLDSDWCVEGAGEVGNYEIVQALLTVNEDLSAEDTKQVPY